MKMKNYYFSYWNETVNSEIHAPATKILLSFTRKVSQFLKLAAGAFSDKITEKLKAIALRQKKKKN